MIKVILRKNLDRIGKAGEIKSVKDGYARNFLLPKGLALIANKENMSSFEIEKKKLEQKKNLEKDKAQQLADKLDGFSCTISAEAQDEVLYGSITAADIVKCLGEEQITVDANAILIENPIKNLGIYEVRVRLHPEITTKIKLWVVGK